MISFDTRLACLTALTCLLNTSPQQQAKGFVLVPDVANSIAKPRSPSSTSDIPGSPRLTGAEIRRRHDTMPGGNTLSSSSTWSSKLSPVFSTQQAEVADADIEQVVGNEVENPSKFGGGKPVRSTAEAKRELLGLLAPIEAGDFPTNRARMAYLVQELQDGYLPIQTVPFFNMATKGKWHLAHSSSLTQVPEPRITISELYQMVVPGEGKQGNFTNTLAWHIVDEDITGHLVVDCTYELDPKGRMVACLEGHTLLPTRKMPKDPEWLARALQRAMPIELFDPDNRGLETTYLDDRLRIVRMEDDFNIFLRDMSALPPSP